MTPSKIANMTIDSYRKMSSKLRRTLSYARFLELKQLQNIQAQMLTDVQNDIGQNMLQQMEAQNGNNQNEWYNNI